VLRTGSHRLELRGHSVLVDDRPVELTTRQAAVLAALVAGGGKVLSRPELLRAAWPDETADQHAVEMTVARLRGALGPGRLGRADGGEARLPAGGGSRAAHPVALITVLRESAAGRAPGRLSRRA
jgi:hypothetical protein